MKKFLMVLALVLCMALPAAAAETPVTTASALKTAVANANNGDTIVIGASISLDATLQSDQICGLYISSDRTLTLRISEGCTLSVSSDAQEVSGIYTEGNLTIEGSGKITAHSSNDMAYVYGVCAASGDVTIRNSVKIAADGDWDVNGIVAQSAQQNVNVTIQDSVSITASGSDASAYGICAYAEDDGNAEVTIQDSANITASSSGNVDVYGIYAYAKDDGNTEVTIQDSANITASGSDNAGVYCIYAYAKDDGNTEVTIQDNANITASGGDSYGIYTSADGTGSFGVTVQNGVVSGELHNINRYRGTITINGGKFTDNLSISNDGVTVSSKPSHEGDYWIVRKQTNLSFGENPVSVKQGANRDVAVIISGDSKLINSVDITGISSDTAVSGLTVTSKDSAIHIAADTSCVPGTYTFNIKAQTEAYGYYSASGDLKITVTSADTPGPEPEPTPTPTPAPVEPVVSEDQLPENVVPAKVTTGENVERVAQIISSDFTSSDLTTDDSNKVIVKPEVAAEAIGNTLGKEVASDDILCFPVAGTEANENNKGKTIMFTFAVSGDQLTYASSAPSKLCVYKLLNSEKAEAFTYAASPSEAADKTFTVQNQDGTDAATIEKGETYLISAYVKDNGTFDLDHNENGGIIDPIAIDTSGTTPSSGSASNGGCNAGFAGLALAAFALLAAKRKK